MVDTRPERKRRLAMAGLVVTLHLLLGWALLRGLPVASETVHDTALAVFDVPPAPPTPPPAPRRESVAAEGRAAPPNRQAEATAIVAPEVPPVSPPPITAAPLAGIGAESDQGSAPEAGPGTGSGGIGNGTGSGDTGEGRGGGAAARAELLSGTIRDRDYPREARKARAEGRVVVRFSVGTDGRARTCAVTRSSGTPALDTVTCRLIEARYRYRPARDRDGTPVEEQRAWQQDWWLERR